MNLFEICNFSRLSASYRLVEVDASFEGDADLAERNLGQLAKRVGFQERCAVAIVRRNREVVLAVPANVRLSKLEYPLTPDVVTLRPQDEEHALKFGTVKGSERMIALSFLRFALRAPLMRDDRLWDGGGASYFDKRPLNFKHDRRDVDVHGGFSYRVLPMNGKVYVAIRLRHRYVDAAWLLDRYDADGLRRLKMRHLLYHYGNRWFPVQLLEVLSRGIAEVKFVPENGGKSISVFDYTRNAAGSDAPSWIRSLDPNSPAIKFRYPGNEKHRYGAAALGKLMLSTDQASVQSLHRSSIKPPDERFRLMAEIVERHFSQVRFGGERVEVSREPLRLASRVFPVPTQRFGQGSVVEVGRNGAGLRLRDLGRERMSRLLDPRAGLAVTSTLDAQYLIAPQSLDRRVVSDFQDRLQKTVGRFTQSGYRMELVVFDDRGTRTLKQQVDAIKAVLEGLEGCAGHGVLVLPNGAKPGLHNFIKRDLREQVQVQCVSAQRLAGHYHLVPRNGQAAYVVPDERDREYVSYLRYTALGVLLVNRQWPWVLGQPTNYDVYVGVDVLQNTAAFCFFYEGGRHCHVRVRESKQKERLLREQVGTIVYEGLRDDLDDLTRPARSIVFRRDGRSFMREWLGFGDAIQELVRDGRLSGDVITGLVEVHKHSALGLRLATESDRGLRNPSVGSWQEMNASEGIVCNTGFPFNLRGSVNPLHVRIAQGNLALRAVLEDTFWMSQLCWPVPDRCMRLPIDLKLCDEVLRAVAAPADDDEAQFDERSAPPLEAMAARA